MYIYSLKASKPLHNIILLYYCCVLIVCQYITEPYLMIPDILTPVK